jgi:excisionase family DNA binding protein
MKRFLKLRECAELMNVSLSNVYALKDAGEIPVHRLGRKKGFRVAEADLEAYLARVRHQSEPVVIPPVQPRLPLKLKHLDLSKNRIQSLTRSEKA